jgi:ABC-type nitrate/sulfonate/bicarbonate transport system substrate-binding protein
MFKNITHLLFTFILVFILSACGANDAPAASVSVQLSWLDNIEFSSFYLAQENGYYADRNLEVTLIPVFDDEGNYRDAITQVTSGEADFAITNSGDVLIAREAGKPVVAIMAIYQRHPLVFTSLAESNIIRPEDLTGKTVHVSATSVAIYQALLGAQDIVPDDVNTIDRTDFTIQSLVNGDADVIDGWVITELAELNAEGIAVNTIYPFEYGVDMYADVIVTTEDMLQNQPDVVQRFIDATLQGLNQAVENPEEAAQITKTKASDIPAEVVDESARLQVPLIRPRESQPGLMTEEIWQLTHDIMTEQGLIAEAASLDAAYDLTFVNAYYEGQ